VYVDSFLAWWESAPIGIWWESNALTHLFLSPEIWVEAFGVVALAFPISVTFAVVSFILGTPLGLGLAFMKMARTRWLRWPATFYVDVVRGTPLFLQILLVFFGLPLTPMWGWVVDIAPWVNQAGPFGVSWSLWFRGVLVLSFNSAAYLCEIFRAGIQSIPRGQMEAARSLGMNLPKAMFYVIIPQTIRRILPTLLSEFILLFKDTALLAAVGIGEMVLRAREVAAVNFNPSSYVLAAGFYLLLTVPLGRLVANLEDRLAQSEGGGGAPPRPPLTADKIDAEHVVSLSDAEVKM
jgi:polar amino acid transport system substrate-binding protein